MPVQMPKSWFQVIVHGSRFQELQYSTAQQTGPEQPDTSTASCLFLSAAFPAKAAFSAASVPTAAAPAASPQFCHMTEGWRDRLDITASRAAYMRRRRSPVQMPAVRLTCLSSRAAGTYAEAGTAAGSAAPHAGMSGRRMLGAQQASAQSLCAAQRCQTPEASGSAALACRFLRNVVASCRAKGPAAGAAAELAGSEPGWSLQTTAFTAAAKDDWRRLWSAAALPCSAACAPAAAAAPCFGCCRRLHSRRRMSVMSACRCKR